jgi:hypothetical protein
VYQLGPGLHCAQANGRLVFLDVPADRYFCLPSEAEPDLDALGPERTSAGTLRALLGDSGAPDSPTDQPRPSLNPPMRSLVDEEAVRPVRWREAPGVARALALAAWRERNWTLERRLAAAERRPPAKAPDIDVLATERARGYRAVRALLPGRPLCLRDSFALLDFMGPARPAAVLVLGVTMDPFAAHAWVQVRDVVLNDSLDHARSFSPIMAV